VIIKPPFPENYINQFDPSVRDILKSLRAIIRKAVPKASEYVEKDMLAYALGPNTYKASVCVISGHKAHVTLGFLRGTKLDDPDTLLRGKGKTVRHLKIMSVTEIPKQVISAWVKQAAKLVPTL
jgi:hypothetical protein